MLLVADREAAEAAFRAHAPEVRPLVPGALVREAEEQPGVHEDVPRRVEAGAPQGGGKGQRSVTV